MTNVSRQRSTGGPAATSQDASSPPGAGGAHGDPSVLARVAALKAASTAQLKQRWRELFEAEPPPYNRRFLESRLAYRIQELSFGGLKKETVERLEALAEQLDGGSITVRRIRADSRPIAGTRLIREWQGIEHTVTVLAGGYEWQGRPYQSLSAVSRAITGTRWNGWTFFGLIKPGGRRV